VKVLLIHNKYKLLGGEEAVVLNESGLLSNYGTEVRVEYLDNSDINTSLDKLKVAFNSLYSQSSKKHFLKIIDEFKPDIIHAHNLFPQISPSIFFLAKELDIPVVQTIHNYRLICPSATLMYDGEIFEQSLAQSFAYTAVLKKIYRNSFFQTLILALHNFTHNKINTWRNKVDGFIFLTDFAKQKHISSQLELDDTRLFVKSNFVEDKGFNTQRKDHFLFVGRLSQEKGIEVLLEAFQKTDHKINIIGDGPLKESVENAASSHSNIKYLGKQPSDVVIEEMKQCKALIFPSIWYEGMPMTILEAFSTGCPVLASNLGAMQSLIVNDVNGLLFEHGNANNLIQKLEFINEKHSIGSRETYETNYAPESNYKYLLDIYKELIQRK